MLSREKMVEVIKGGGSVLHNGRLITKEANLPTAASLAKTPEEKAVAVEDIDAQIAKLQAQKDAALVPPVNIDQGPTDDELAKQKEAEGKAAQEAAEKEAADKAAAEAKAKADKEAADKAAANKGQK